MGAVDLSASSALAVDLSADARRQREFARECVRIAEADEAKARRKWERARRLPVNSNGRRKLEREATQLGEHAATMRAAALGA